MNVSFGQPIGYAYDAALHCTFCAAKYASAAGIDLNDSDACQEHEINAVFESSETDAPDHCDECNAFIPLTFTPDAIRYVLNTLHSAMLRRDVLDTWAEHIGHYGLSRKQERVVSRYLAL